MLCCCIVNETTFHYKTAELFLDTKFSRNLVWYSINYLPGFGRAAGHKLLGNISTISKISEPNRYLQAKKEHKIYFNSEQLYC